MAGSFFIVFFFVLEYVKRRFQINSEYTRKFAHIFGGLGVLISSFYLNQLEYLSLTLFFLFVFLISFKKKLLKLFTEISRKSYGEITYLMGLILLGLFMYNTKNLFYCGLLLLIFPDSVAGLIGYQINKQKKTLVGSFIYFLLALFILLQFFPSAYSIPFAVLLSLTEYFSPYGLDNFSIPLVYILVVNLFL